MTDEGDRAEPAPQPEQDLDPARADEGRLWRRRSSRVVGGVAGGLADHLGVDVLWVRITFAALAALGGAGVLAYGLLWMFVPQRPAGGAEPGDTSRQRQQAFGLVAVGVAMALLGGMISGTFGNWVTGPLWVALVGAALVWREADEAQRRRWRAGARSGVMAVVLGDGGRSALVRVLSGAALVVAGIAVFLLGRLNLDQVQFALLAVLAALVGVAVLTVPWWLRLVRDLGEERRARIRTDERAEIAAHLHDSVLQTLALIQKHAEGNREVRRLARGQERQLRTWLYGPSGYGAVEARTAEEPVTLAGGGTFAEAIASACGEVEDRFAINVQQVVVGDCPMDDRLTALVQAAREAIVNAAKHADVAEVSVYAEVEPELLTVFVRDRGKGFDPEAVSEDRHGLADSIRGRMGRNGGEVGLRTTPGEGTEVRLSLPRKSKEVRA